ncbi:hypothetical protein [Exiguobacterium sp. s80]|uniref:hypothetical protein n=1 Tax=Exiguobacterium sp. s80 TaxID=2751209 RepID=UPI001BEC9D45|nr:hypothetical protein [Exiguobacterium sp. s80]
MKKYTFLGIVLVVLATLFSLHYATNLIDDTALRISLLVSLIVVLIVRKQLNITFSPASKS